MKKLTHKELGKVQKTFDKTFKASQVLKEHFFPNEVQKGPVKLGK